MSDLPTPPSTVPAVLVDLAFGSEDLDRAQAAAENLFQRGWNPVRGLATGVFPALFEWCYSYAVDDASPEESRFRILAGRPGTLDPDDIVYEALLLSTPEWVAIEQELRLAVVAVGNFSLLEARPYDPGFFEKRMKGVVASTFADGRVLGATLAPWQPPESGPPDRRPVPPRTPRRKRRRRQRS